LRQQRRILAGILLLLATFTKETALIVSFGLLLEALLLRRQRNIQDQWFPVLAPIISYLLWQTWLKSIWDNATVSPAAISTNLGLPFFGISPFIQSLFPPMDYLQQVWLLEIFLMALFLLATVYVFLWSAARPFIKISWLLFAALMFSLTQAVWVEDWAFLRVFSETYLFSVLILLESKSVLKKWVLGEVVFSWTLLATEMLKMR
jgi:hypothetical protein